MNTIQNFVAEFAGLIHWTTLPVCALVALLLFRDLADVSQWWLKVRRSVVMHTWYRRHWYAAITVLTGALAIFTHTAHGVGIAAIYWPTIVLSIALFLAGYVNPGLMMRSQQHDGWFVGIEEAGKRVRPRAEVMVVEHNGVARAHPDYEMWRPHIAGHDDGLDGENIVLTYCALTNLGMAYRPEIEGRPVELKVFQQLENNLIMWDKNTGEPIQQLWGSRECDGKKGPSMPEYPSFKMPFEKFAAAYPDGKIFLHHRPPFWQNPLLYVYDKAWDGAFYLGIHQQRQNEEFVFPTIRHHDDRVHQKEHVWGFNVGDDYVCYTRIFVRNGGDLLNVSVGGRDIAVHWDDEYESLGVWYNDSGQPVRELNFFGQSDQGQLQRVESVKAGAFFGIWANFFPQTDVNRFEPVADAA